IGFGIGAVARLVDGDEMAARPADRSTDDTDVASGLLHRSLDPVPVVDELRGGDFTVLRIGRASGGGLVDSHSCIGYRAGIGSEDLIGDDLLGFGRNARFFLNGAFLVN